MNTGLFLLVLLSQNGAGDISAAFVGTENREQCRQKQALVEGIFSSARIPVLESRCIESDLRFTPFDHQASSRAGRHFYLIRFAERRVEIRPVDGWRGCMERAAKEERLYCASSVQRRIPQSSRGD